MPGAACCSQMQPLRQHPQGSFSGFTGFFHSLYFLRASTSFRVSSSLLVTIACIVGDNGPFVAACSRLHWLRVTLILSCFFFGSFGVM